MDTAIVGGGIAGLWLYNALRRQGYSALLFEADALGCDQTLASQGMIHGGLKYALGGMLTRESEAIAAMPSRWQACLEGNLSCPGDVSLAGVTVQSPNYYMFAQSRGIGQLTSFFASRALRGRIDKVKRTAWPPALAGLDGVVYQLNDFVLDTRSLLRHLSGSHTDYLYQHCVSAENIQSADNGYRLYTPAGVVEARYLLCCAGNGSVKLVTDLGLDLAIQQRPLKQVIVHPKHHEPLYAHCLTDSASAEPRLTITTDHKDGRTVWYLGGKLATSGVARTDEEQIAYAQQELQHCLPWLDWQDCEYEALWVNRAEPAQSSGLKPDNAYVEQTGRFVLCFPTKLTLTPDLADRVLAGLDAPLHPQPAPLNLPPATTANSPWQIN